ncbi:MAG: tetratricopeptide repeat protein [Prevotella sp.]|nr:tetratricopeptide repeat protein [Prevotella sp.]
MKNILYVSAAILMLTGCHPKSHTPDRSPEQKQHILELEDSLTNLSPKASDMIDQGMAGAKDSLTWYDFYLRRGKFWLLSQTPDSLIPYADRTISFAESQKPSPRINGLKAHAYEYKATLYQRFRSNLDEAIRLRTKAYEAMMESDNTDYLPDMCANMADVYGLKNDMAMAASWYRRALFLVDSLSLPETKSITLYLGLAHIYRCLEDYDTSLHYYNETTRFYDKMQPNMKTYYLNNFGNYHYYLGNYNQALNLFLRLEKQLTQYGDEGIDMAICRINMADVYLNIGEFAKARSYVERAEHFFRKHGVDVGVYYANSVHIGIAMKEGRMSEVENILRSEKVAVPMEYSLVGIRNKYMREYYKATGNWQAAFRNMENEIKAHDSIAEDRQHMRASEIMQRLKEDTLSLHHALEIQRKDAILRNTHMTTAALIIIAALLMLWWVALSRKRKLQVEMDVMQLKLDNARNRISPHFIFNVLNNRISTADRKETDELMMLVRLIRANLDISRNTFVSLDEEMEFVRYYVDIEKTILGDDFTFTVEAPEDDVLRQISIPTMFVQILVENAIKHGLRGRDGEKRLTVTIRHGKDGTDITVADNGRGFDIRSSATNGTRTGLDIIRHTIRIINQRMRSDDMTFSIHNSKNAEGQVTGCISKLHIPVLPPPEYYEETH